MSWCFQIFGLIKPFYCSLSQIAPSVFLAWPSLDAGRLCFSFPLSRSRQSARFLCQVMLFFAQAVPLTLWDYPFLFLRYWAAASFHRFSFSPVHLCPRFPWSFLSGHRSSYWYLNAFSADQISIQSHTSAGWEVTSVCLWVHPWPLPVSQALSWASFLCFPVWFICLQGLWRTPSKSETFHFCACQSDPSRQLLSFWVLLSKFEVFKDLFLCCLPAGFPLRSLCCNWRFG